MLAGLFSAIISDLDQAVAQDWRANVSIYLDRPMYRSICWLACLLPVSLILVSPTMAQDRLANVSTYVDRAVFMKDTRHPPVFLILVQPRPKIAGRQCQYRPVLASQFSASTILILVKPWNTIAGQCIALCWAPVLCRYF